MNCFVYGNIKSYGTVAGIIGHSYCNSIINTDFSGIVEARKGKSLNSAGGIVAHMDRSKSSINNCTVYGTIKGSIYAGGIAGFADYSDNYIKDCVFKGIVVAENTSPILAFKGYE